LRDIEAFDHVIVNPISHFGKGTLKKTWDLVLIQIHSTGTKKITRNKTKNLLNLLILISVGLLIFAGRHKKLSWAGRRSSEDFLRSFSTNASSQLNVLGHDGHSLRVDCTEVGVFEQSNQVGLRRFLERQDCGALKSEIVLEVLRDFTHQALERQLANQEVGTFLVPSDFSKRHGTRAIAVRLLDSACSGSALARRFCRELLAGRLASREFSCSLLCSSHDFCFCFFLKFLAQSSLFPKNTRKIN
jgi:hypothetical protein